MQVYFFSLAAPYFMHILSYTIFNSQITEITQVKQRCISFDFIASLFHGISVFVDYLAYLPTPPLGQDVTQGQFLSGV